MRPFYDFVPLVVYVKCRMEPRHREFLSEAPVMRKTGNVHLAHASS